MLIKSDISNIVYNQQACNWYGKKRKCRDNYLLVCVGSLQDDKLYVYNISHTPGEAHTLRNGYPKSVKEGLGLEGHIDAAFICPNEAIAHVIQGNKATTIQC